MAGDDVLRTVKKIRDCWDEFAVDMEPCVQENFPRHLREMEGNYARGRYESALSDAEKLREFCRQMKKVRKEENNDRFAPIESSFKEIAGYIKQKL